jgi:hypothetical protein
LLRFRRGWLHGMQQMVDFKSWQPTSPNTKGRLNFQT